MRYSKEIIRDWIGRCLEEGRNISDWEREFLESVSEQFDRRGLLTDRQEEILERIYDEKVP